VYDEKYQFKSKKEAADSIKRAARLFGAELVGITHRNKKWDYSEHYNPMTHEEISWDKFPFEPKSVIVLAVEMRLTPLKGRSAKGIQQWRWLPINCPFFLNAWGIRLLPRATIWG
jgi:hypothetical protein